MKTFRIKQYKRGFLNLYKPQIKKWYGWKSFYCFSDGDRGLWLWRPTIDRWWCEKNIEYYRLRHGLNKDEILILNN